MNRTIKFRGKRVDNGEFVYGDLIQDSDATFIRIKHNYSLFVFSNGNVSDPRKIVKVEPESVAQLVTYDCDGREVYEGDIIIDFNEDNKTFIVTMERVYEGYHCKLKEVKT